MADKIRFEVVTAESKVYLDNVDEIVLWGVEGQMGILPHHAPLLTILIPGYILVRKDNEEHYLAATGGILEVLPDKVIILADACDRTEGYDLTMADVAKKRAEWIIEETLKAAASKDHAVAEAALLRSLSWVRMAQKKKPPRKAI
ncbi:MAG: ATP synthase F1 subunit epsilon [Proteobacteria bacterium]|nr:ATP synthase F1 subunit epsilon [Pseudomonadota bacterium]